MVPCPVCCGKKDVYAPDDFCMRVLNDPAGGYAWSCTRCSRTWDSVELIADVDHRGDVRSALDWIIRDSHIPIPATAADPQSLDRYQLLILGERRAYRAWSDRARQRWTRHRDMHDMLARALRVMTQLKDSDECVRRGVGRWLHVTGADELASDLNLGVPLELPNAFRNCLAIPWHSLPGRLSALLLIGRNEDVRLWVHGSAKDPGLMMLDTLQIPSQRVYAVSSPYLALWMQSRNLEYAKNPLPIVVWHDDTDPGIWSTLGADEIVFWSYSPGPGIFRHALRAPNSRVAFASPVEDSSIAYVNGSFEHPQTWATFSAGLCKNEAAYATICDLANRARQPHEACRDYLLDLDPSHVADAVDLIRLDPGHIQAVLDACDPNDECRGRLERLMRRSVRECKHFMFGGEVAQYIGDDRATWTLTRRGAPELLSEAVVRLDRCVRGSDSDRTLYTGVIHFRGHELPFAITKDDLLTNPVRRITDAVEAAGYGTPFISAAHSSRIWDLIMRFSAIDRTTPALTRVGWDGAGLTFSFPRFSISGGRVSAFELYDDASLPCRNVDIPREIDVEWLRELVTDTPLNAVLWALLASVIDCVVAPAEKRSPRPVAVVGEIGRYLLGRLGDNLGLREFSLVDLEDDVSVMDKTQRSHDVPVIISGSGEFPAALSRWMSSFMPKRALVVMTETQASSAGLCHDWTIVSSAADLSGSVRGNLSDLVVSYLSDYQRMVAFGARAKQSALSVLGDLRAWASARVECDAVFDSAVNALRDLGDVSILTRFVATVMQLERDGYLRQAHGPYSGADESTILIDSVKGRVYVSKSGFVGALRTRGLPLVDTSILTASLRHSGCLAGEIGIGRSVWAIHMDEWNNSMSACLSSSGYTGDQSGGTENE